MKIITLCENVSLQNKNNLLSEHGLSFFIQTSNHNILFDFGQSDSILHNAKLLNIDLSCIDLAILSHGHYDHSGGLKHFLKINNKAKIYINENAMDEYFNVDKKYIGIDSETKDYILRDLSKSNSRFIITKNYLKLLENENIELFTCNEQNFVFDSYGLCKKINNNFISDKFLHEQYLLIKENNKKVLFSGCSHKGILNLQSAFNPDYIFGGFHFMKLDVNIFEERKKLLNAAEQLSTTHTKYFTCHCTGQEQFRFLKSLLPDNLEYCSCGSKFEI